MKLLAIETATEACSAALWVDGEIHQRYQLAPRVHNRLILPMVDELLAEGGFQLTHLDALAFGRGPGSFTGVRMAAGVVQGLAFGADLPVAPVSTLAALAAEVLAETDAEFAFPCIDARMSEVYWGVYRRAGLDAPVLVGAEAVTSADAVAYPEEAVGFGIGSGWASYAPELTVCVQEQRILGCLAERFPHAAWIARLGAEIFARGEAVAAELAQPVYLRDKVAKKMSGSW